MPALNSLSPIRLRGIYIRAPRRGTQAFIYMNLKGGVEFENSIGEGLSGKFYIGPYLKIRDKAYVDPDTGAPYVITLIDTDISESLSYMSFGIESEYAHEFGLFEVEFGADVAYFNYEERAVVSSYDLAMYKADAGLSYSLSAETVLSAYYSYVIEDFAERNPHELNGTIASSGNVAEYHLHEFSVMVKQRLSDQLLTYLSLGYILRGDEYVGYYDFTQSEVKLRAAYKANKNLKINGKARYRKREYDNAFAFDVAGQPVLERKSVDLTLIGEYDPGELLPFGDAWSLWGEYGFRRENSTDPRYDYKVHQIMLGVKWEG